MLCDAVRLVEDQGGRGRGLEAARAFGEGEVIGGYSREFRKFGATDAGKRSGAPTLAELRERHCCTHVGSGGTYWVSDAARDAAAAAVRRGDKCAPTTVAVGALVNDAVEPSVISRLLECKTVGDVSDWRNHYAVELIYGCPQRVNVMMIEADGPGRGLVAIAARDIAAGDALLTSYGTAYWVEQTLLEHAQIKPPPRGPLRAALAFECMLGENVFPLAAIAADLQFAPVIARRGARPTYLVASGTPVSEMPKSTEQLADRWLEWLGAGGEGAGGSGTDGYFATMRRAGAPKPLIERRLSGTALILTKMGRELKYLLSIVDGATVD
jgi:hypothetical protein